MTNQPQLPQDTLDRLAMLESSQEEMDAAFYRILTNHIPQDMIDGIWQEIKQAGIFVAASTRDGAEGAGEAKCATCGIARKEHSINGDAYGVCGKFMEFAPPKPAPDAMREALAAKIVLWLAGDERNG